MHKLLLLAICLGFLFVGSEAQAQVYVSPYGYSYGVPFYPAYSYVPPVYSYNPYPAGYYVPPYSWSARYYVTPRSSGWYSGQYYPGTNTYYYYYGRYPRWGWRY